MVITDKIRQRTRMTQKIVLFRGVAAHDAICTPVQAKHCSAHVCIRIYSKS